MGELVHFWVHPQPFATMLVVVRMRLFSRTLALAGRYRVRGRPCLRGSGDRRRRPRQAGQRPDRAVEGRDRPAPGRRSRGRGVGRAQREKPRADRRAVYRALTRARKRGSRRRRTGAGGRGRERHPHLPPPARRARPARLRDRRPRGVRAAEHAQPHSHAGRLRAARAQPALWRSLPFPAARDQVSFGGSEVLYVYFPGEGLQLHPLSTFKKANNMHGACERGEPTCDRAGLKRLLDEMEALAVQRSSKFIAWEYSFAFDGGARPGSAAWRTPPGSRRTGARPTCSAIRTTSTSRARRSAPRRRRHWACARSASPAASTASTRSRRASTSSTRSCSR